LAAAVENEFSPADPTQKSGPCDFFAMLDRAEKRGANRPRGSNGNG